MAPLSNYNIVLTVRILQYFSVCGLLAQTGENVLVIANENSAHSRQIAGHYAKRRTIPPAHLCVLKTTVQERVKRQIYEGEIEAAVRVCLEKPAVARQPIHYLVTTLGVPLRIEGTSGRTGGFASVDSELAALLLRRLGRKTPIEGAFPNPFYGQSYAPFSQRQFPIYLVARLAAYDVATVIRMIDRSLEASNRGFFVFDLKTGFVDNDGDDWLERAAQQFPASRVRMDRGKDVLANLSGVVGYAGWGSNDPNRKHRKLGFSWLPGSVASEFVSSNGRTTQRPPDHWTFGKWDAKDTYFANSPQSLAADYLDEGASAATGHTDEPYLNLTPRPDFLFPAYYSGRTLGESYYLSIPAISWTNVLFGDPLMRIGKP